MMFIIPCWIGLWIPYKAGCRGGVYLFVAPTLQHFLVSNQIRYLWGRRFSFGTVLIAFCRYLPFVNVLQIIGEFYVFISIIACTVLRISQSVWVWRTWILRWAIKFSTGSRFSRSLFMCSAVSSVTDQAPVCLPWLQHDFSLTPLRTVGFVFIEFLLSVCTYTFLSPGVYES